MANSQNNSETDISKKILVVFSNDPLLVNPVKKIWGDDSTFKQINKLKKLENFLEKSNPEKIMFVVDIGKNCKKTHIEIAQKIQKKFPNAQRVATGTHSFEPAKLRDYNSNACNIVKTHSELPEFIQQIKKIDSHQKTSS